MAHAAADAADAAAGKKIAPSIARVPGAYPNGTLQEGYMTTLMGIDTNGTSPCNVMED